MRKIKLIIVFFVIVLTVSRIQANCSVDTDDKIVIGTIKKYKNNKIIIFEKDSLSDDKERVIIKDTLIVINDSITEISFSHNHHINDRFNKINKSDGIQISPLKNGGIGVKEIEDDNEKQIFKLSVNLNKITESGKFPCAMAMRKVNGRKETLKIYVVKVQVYESPILSKEEMSFIYNKRGKFKPTDDTVILRNVFLGNATFEKIDDILDITKSNDSTFVIKPSGSIRNDTTFMVNFMPFNGYHSELPLTISLKVDTSESQSFFSGFNSKWFFTGGVCFLFLVFVILIFIHKSNKKKKHIETREKPIEDIILFESLEGEKIYAFENVSDVKLKNVSLSTKLKENISNIDNLKNVLVSVTNENETGATINIQNENVLLTFDIKFTIDKQDNVISKSEGIGNTSESDQQIEDCNVASNTLDNDEFNEVFNSENKKKTFIPTYLTCDSLTCFNPDGFRDEDIKENYYNGIFVIKQITTDEAELSFNTDVEIQLRRIGSMEKILKRICKEHIEVWNPSFIKTVNPGKLKKEGNKWIIAEKIEIELKE